MATSLLPGSSRAIDLDKGELLFRRGDPADALYIVESGSLRLERTLEDGGCATLAVLGPGDTLAEAALFSDRYHCDALVAERARVRRFEKDDVLELLGTRPAEALPFVRHLAGEVRRLRGLLEVRSILRAEERILAYLDLLTARGESWDGARPLRSMADEIGLSPEALYRSLARLERTSRIVRDGGAVRRAP